MPSVLPFTVFNRSRRSGRPAILHRDDDHTVFELDVHVDDDQPPPRPKDESESRPQPSEWRPKQRELLERLDRAPHPVARVGWQAVTEYQPVEILDGRTGDLDASQALQLVETNGIAAMGLIEPALRPFESAGDCVEHVDNVARIGICVVDRMREKRPGQRPLVDVSPLREATKLRLVRGVQRDIQTSHRADRTR